MPRATAAPAPEAATMAAPAKADPGPRRCGCSLCEPIFSDDACGTDADCAPSEPCHAPRCVAVSRAHLPKPGEMCTQMLACLTADANRCGCLEGKCALAPR